MKLMRIGPVGSEIPCLMGDDGMARDVSSLFDDFTPETLGRPLYGTLMKADLDALPTVDLANQRIGPPVGRPRTIFCIGLNYSDHAEEAGMAPPDEPIVFSKATSAYCGPNDPIQRTRDMAKVDWEAELGIVIGHPAFRVSEEDAYAHVFGYTVVNDVSERAFQIERSGQWIKGKSFPSFCPTGPYLVGAHTIPDPQSLNLWLDVNGERQQTGNTSSMIFSVATIVSYLSHFMKLEPGDLICTGTPPGVGMGKKPPRYLTTGDVVTLGIDGLGEQHQVVETI